MTFASLGVVLIAAGMILGIAAWRTGTLPGDEATNGVAQRPDGAPWSWLAGAGNLLGSTAFAATAIVLVILLFAVLRKRHIVVYLAMVGVLRLIATQLKPLFDSPRPTTAEAIQRVAADGTGYPSGHATSAAAIATALALIVWCVTPSPLIRGTAIVLLALMALVVGWARMWSGVHWPSDVLGGWLFGAGIALLPAGLLSGAIRNVGGDADQDGEHRGEADQHIPAAS